MTLVADPASTNERKYREASGSLLLALLLRRFYREVARHLAPFAAVSVLDAGCGEGHSLAYLRHVLPDDYVGVDESTAAIDACRAKRLPGRFLVQSLYELDFAARSRDVVLCLEVLEHLAYPDRALARLATIASHGLVLSVPFEPWFRLGNLARGRHVLRLGNHPEHIQHWGPLSFRRFLSQHVPGAEVKLSIAGPWLIASLRKAGTRS